MLYITCINSNAKDTLALKQQNNIKLYENVCVIPNQVNDFKQTKKFLGRLKVYDDKTYKYSSDYYAISLHTGRALWAVDHENEMKMPSNKLQNKPFNLLQPVFEDKVALFPWLWRIDDKATIFTLIYRMLPGVYNQMEWLRSQKDILDIAHIDNNRYFLVAPLISMFDTFEAAFRALSFDIISFERDSQEQPLCFKYAVFGTNNSSMHSVYKNVRYRNEIKNKLEAQWIDKTVCQRNAVVLLERQTTRLILNKEKLISRINQAGFTNTSIVSFEGLSLREQMKIIHCANVFIAAQGAALTWFQYLPKDAVVIEIVWHGWPVKYKVRINQDRPDISAHVLKCEARVSEKVWREFAWEWYQYEGDMTEDIKDKIKKKSSKIRAVRKQVWKYSDCVCSPEQLVNLLI